MKRKLNIALLSAFYPPASLTGTELFNEITVQLLNKKHNVTVVSSDSFSTHYLRNIFFNPRISKNKLNEKGEIIRLRHNPVKAFLTFVAYKCVSFPPFSIFFSKLVKDYIFQIFYGPQINIKHLEKILLDHDFDLIYLSSLPYAMNYYAVKIIKLYHLKTKIIIRPNYHQNTYPKNNIYYNFVLQQSNAIHVWTHAEKEQISTDYHINLKKIQLIAPPICSTNHSSPKLFRNIKNQNKFILYAGAKNEEKGIYHLVKAMQEIGDNSLTLVTIGSYDIQWTLFKVFHRLPFLKDLGYVDHKIKESLFKSCTMFCLPSNADSFCFASIDAWKYKKPVILAKNDVSDELMKKIQGGFTIDPKINNELSQKIQILLSHPRAAQKIGVTGFNNIYKYYSEAKNRSAYLNMFQ